MPPCVRPIPTRSSLVCRTSSTSMTPSFVAENASPRRSSWRSTMRYLVRVVSGRLAAVERGPFLLRSWSFAVRASAHAWIRFWEPLPAPGYHDLFAMKKLGVARVEGDLWPLMAHLRYVKDVLAAPRRARSTG